MIYQELMQSHGKEKNSPSELGGDAWWISSKWGLPELLRKESAWVEIISILVRSFCTGG